MLRQYDGLGLASPRVILDLGSHIGASILRFRADYPEAKIYGFEPDPAAFMRLEQNVKQLPGVAVQPWALSDKDGYAEFFSRFQSWESSMMPHGAESRLVRVESVCLDTALSRLGLPNVDLVKIDIEGAEASVLRSFRDIGRVRMIVGEVHGEAVCDEMMQALSDFDVEWRGTPSHATFVARKKG